MGFFLRWLLITLGILLVPYLVSGVQVNSVGSALVAGAVLAFLNIFLKPVLIILTLPLTFFSFGFFLLVLNALIFEFAAWFVPGVEIASFWSAMGASIFVSTVTWVGHALTENRLVFRLEQSGSPRRAGSSRRVLEMHQASDGKWE